MDIWVDGKVRDSQGNTTGTYTATENTTAPVSMGFFYGAEARPTEWFQGSIAGGPCGPVFTKKSLSDDELNHMFEMCATAMGLRPELARAPYLQNTTVNSVTLAWKTRDPVPHAACDSVRINIRLRPHLQ